MVDVVKATPEHPFFTTHGLVSAANLGIGTELVTRAGPKSHNAQALVVKSVTPVKATIGKDGKRAGFVVYNLEIEDDHTYFVGDAGGGAWVHNACKLDTERLAHIIRRHKTGGSGSQFFRTEQVTSLIRSADSVATQPGYGGRFLRVAQANRNIGVDKTTGALTDIYTVVTDAADNVRTVHPGVPTGCSGPITPVTVP